MTNNTIPNVPRELLAELQEHIDCHRDAVLWGKVCYLLSTTSPTDHVEGLRAMVADPSPAGVDGCKCSMSISMLGDGCRHCQPQEYIDRLGEMLDEERAELSDAQAIIDGLRGENERIRLNIAEYNEAISCYQSERDQQAQRIGELEAALEFACKALAQVTSSDGSGHADIAVSVLRMAGTKDSDALHVVEAYKAGAKWRIDAALSAGKEGE